MRTIETKLYTFEELSEEAKQRAVRKYRESGAIDTSFYWNDAHESVKKFHDVFGTESGSNSWLDLNLHSIDDQIDALRGLRLQKYIWNNYHSDLFKGKYYSLWSKIEVSYKHYKDGYPVLKQRHSKILLDNSCVMTGMCYDMDLLDPIYDFLEAKPGDSLCGWMFDRMSISDLFEECLSSLRKSLEDEDEYRYSYEGIEEDLVGQDYEFEEDGTRH